MAAQEYALSMRSIEAGVYHTRQAPETVQQIIAGCKMQEGTVYVERHNQVAGLVYRNICTEVGLEVTSSEYKTPRKFVEND